MKKNAIKQKTASLFC